MKKYNFLLLEVFIGFALTALVLGLIFSSLYQEIVLKKKLSVGEKEMMERAKIQQRLDHLLANLAPGSKEGKKSSLFLDSDSVLHIQFDNGLEPNPAFCGLVEAEIRIENQSLILNIKKKDLERKEVLKENVSKINYEFLTHDQKKITTTSTWDEKNLIPPCYLKMKVDEVDYVFWVNSEQAPFPIRGKKK